MTGGDDTNGTSSKNSPTSIEATCIPISVSVFVVGILLASIILVWSPSLYRKLRLAKKRLRKCRSNVITCIRRKATTPTRAQNRARMETVRYYTEIDEESLSPNVQVGRVHISQNYEDIAEEKDQHRYSYVEQKMDKYEDVVGQNLETKDSVTGQQPVYHILEPSTYKRLPVRPYSVNDTLNEDKNNVYFVLEPNTNNVKPTFEKPSDDSSHTYFVLEPHLLSDESFDVGLYAVGDLNRQQAYFMLEKTF